MWRFFYALTRKAVAAIIYTLSLNMGKRKAPVKALLIFKELGEKIISPYR